MRRALLIAWLACAAPALADQPDAGEAAPPAAPSLPAAEPLGFKAALDKAEVGLADPFSLSVEIRHPASDTYDLPARLDWKSLGVRSRKIERTGEDPVVTRILLQLQAFEVGDVEIPALRLTVDTPSGTRLFELPAQKIKVNGIIDPAQGEPRMREDSRPLPRVKRPLWWPLWVLAALAAAIAAFIYLARPATIPRARASETGQKAISYHPIRSMFRTLTSNSPFSAPRDDTARASFGNGAKSNFLSSSER